MNDEMEDNANETFVIPSQGNSEKLFKYENCEFEAARKSDVMKHKTANHNWCSFCFSSFVTQERLKLHISKRIVIYWRLTELTMEIVHVSMLCAFILILVFLHRNVLNYVWFPWNIFCETCTFFLPTRFAGLTTLLGVQNYHDWVLG